MTTILVFDTETTGKADFRAPPSAPQQPSIVQLAAKLIDERQQLIHAINFIVHPVKSITPEAAEVHGIDMAYVARYGMPMDYVMRIWWLLTQRADLLVAHNIDFDLLVINAELWRLTGHPVDQPTFCTMKAATPVCKIPSPYKRGHFKWPKLTECYEMFFNETLVGAHDAMTDVDACARVYFHLQSLKKET